MLSYTGLADAWPPHHRNQVIIVETPNNLPHLNASPLEVDVGLDVDLEARVFAHLLDAALLEGTDRPAVGVGLLLELFLVEGSLVYFIVVVDVADNEELKGLLANLDVFVLLDAVLGEEECLTDGEVLRQQHLIECFREFLGGLVTDFLRLPDANSMLSTRSEKRVGCLLRVARGNVHELQLGSGLLQGIFELSLAEVFGGAVFVLEGEEVTVSSLAAVGEVVVCVSDASMATVLQTQRFLGEDLLEIVEGGSRLTVTNVHLRLLERSEDKLELLIVIDLMGPVVEGQIALGVLRLESQRLREEEDPVHARVP
mmetsp:Transcript_37484/g.57404  ORF Transcript_37484/g.57404 Transcript_37484/m.57404 type:complete len:313 (-) Transcript_37484:2531-3469(-)